MARYQALARGITIQATLERLAAVCDSDAEGAECNRTLRESYLSLKQMQLEHHAEAVRAGRKPDNTIETRTLRPLARANLQEALRAVAAAQTRLSPALRGVAQPLTRRSAGCRYLFLFRPSCRAGLRGAARNRLPTGVPRAAAGGAPRPMRR